MKRHTRLVVVLGMAATLAWGAPAMAEEAAPAAGSPQDILASIQGDFTATAESLSAGFAQVNDTVGGTFDGYLANTGALDAWYETVSAESQALFDRTQTNALAYYRAVAATVDHGDSDALGDAMDELYDLIYEDAYEDYYDDVYEDLLDEAYDTYYDGIIDDAEDSVDFGTWIDARSDAYGDWLDVRSDVFGAYLDGRSVLYGDILDVKSAFWRGFFDVDAVVTVLPEPQIAPEKFAPVAHDGTPEGILAAIEGDYVATADALVASFGDTCALVSDTFEGYVANEQAVLAWYASTVGETQALYARTRAGLAQYYEAVLATIDHGDFDALSDAVDDAYDRIYEDASDGYYGAVYEDLFDDAYDVWYDGAIDDASETVEYNEWSLVNDRSYRAWDRAHSRVYDAIDSGRGDIYDDNDAVSGALYDDVFDIAVILDLDRIFSAGQDALGQAAPQAPAEAPAPAAPAEEAPAPEPSAEDAPAEDTSGIGALLDGVSGVVDGVQGVVDGATDAISGVVDAAVDPAFKAAMDGYEAFIDEFIAFMETYANSANPLELMDDYMDYMTRYGETIAALTAVDTDSLSAADVAYYTATYARISEKLLTAGL